MANKDVDSRIVEMQFDSKDFDKNIRKSQKTFDDFKKSLNFDDAAKQMSEWTEVVEKSDGPISQMAKNVAKLAKEFTGIGSISTYIAQKVKKAWQGAADSVLHFVKSMTSEQVDVGSEKYDKLLKSVQTIMNATGDAETYVYQVMNKLNKYTDETSYDFADMAANIGKFTTAGVALGDAEEEMEGIANWAALAGQGVTEAQRAMYNISQAMSSGSMQLRDYRSIQNANMDIRKFRAEALKAAVAAKTLKETTDGVYKTVKGNKEVNLDNFTETLQYGWFDKKTMETVFKTFADNTKGIGKEAYKAAQRCTTLTDAIKAWKDMLSTGWMKTYENIFGKLSDAMALFSGLCNKVSDSLSKLVEIRNEILERWNIGGGRNALWGALFGEMESPDGDILFKGAYGLLDGLIDLGEAVQEAFWDFVGNFISPNNKALFETDKAEYGMRFLSEGITQLTQKFQAFTQKIKDFLFTAGEGETENRFERIKHIAQAIFAVITRVVEVIRGVASFVGEVLSQLKPAFHAVELLIDMLLQMFTGKIVEGTKKNTIGKYFHDLATIAKPFTSAINTVVQAIVSFVSQIIVMLKQSGLLTSVFDIFRSLVGMIAKGANSLVNSGAIKTVFSWIQTGISKIPAFVDKIKEMGKSFSNLVKNSKGLKSIGNFLSNLFGGKNAKDALKNLKTGVTNGLVKKIPTIIPTLKSGISNVFGSLFGNLFGVNSATAEGSEKVAENISDAIAKPIEELGKSNVIKDAIDKAKPGLLQTLKEKIKEIWENITNFFTTLGNSEAIQKIKNFFAGTNFKDLLTGAKDILKWLAIFRTGSGLVSIGKGAKSLGKGVKMFGKHLKDLNLSNIFSNMFNISNVINSNNNDNSRRTDFSNFGKQMLMVAGAIAAIVAAAVVISKMKPEELTQAGIALAAVIGGLVSAAYLAKKFGGNGGSILALATAVLVLLIPLKIIQKMNWSTLIDGAEKLAVILSMLVLAGKIAGEVKMKGFVGLAAAVTILLIPLKILGNMKLFNNPNATQGLVQGILAVCTLLLFLGGAAGLSGGNKLKGMISTAIALTLLIIPIKAIGNMDLGKAIQGVLAIELILLTITGMIVKTKDADKTKLAGIVGAITALAAVGWLIGHTMDWTQALIGFIPIIGMLGMMALMFKTAGGMKEEQLKALKKIFTTLAVVVGIIAVAIGALAYFKVDWTIIATFFGGIILILVAVGAMMKLAAKTDAAAIGKLVGVFAVLSLLVAVVGGSLVAMAHFNVDWGMIAAFMVGLSLLIGVLAWALPKLQTITPTGAIVGILALAAAVIAIMGAIGLMVPYVLGQVGNSLETMAARLKTISGLLEDFFDRGEKIDMEKVDHTKQIFDKLKELILSFVGFGEYEEAIKSVTTQLLYLSSGLDMFFVNEDKYPDPENSASFKILNKFKELAPDLAAISFGSLPFQLMYLGSGIKLFHESVKDITDTEPPALGLLQGIFGQADNIEKFTKLPLESFRSQMSGLGGAMSLYAKGAKEVTGLDADAEGDVPDIADSVEILKSVCRALSGEDGEGEFKIPDKMPSSDELGLFAGQLESLGNALSTFATAAKDMETNTTNAMALLKFLAEIGGYVTSDNLNVVHAFDDVGHVDENGKGGLLGQFALDITALGTALSSFAGAIGGNESSFSTGLGVLEKFSDLNDKLTVDSLKFTKVFGDAGIDETALGTFGTDIGALGTALKSFAENVIMDNGQKADFDHAIEALDFLATIQSRLPEIGGLHDLIYGSEKSLASLGDDVQILGQSLHDFSAKITGTEKEGGFNLDPVNDALEFVSKLVTITGILNSKLSDENSSYYNDYGYAVTNLVGFLSTLDSEMAGYYNNLEGLTIFDLLMQYAVDISNAFKKVEGIVDSDAIAIFKDIASSLADLVVLDMNSEFSYPGEMIAKGLATGISKGQSQVVNATVAVVKAAIKAGKEVAVIKSPSRVFEEMGEYMDLGLVKGLEGKSDETDKATINVFKSMMDNARKAMLTASQLMLESLDLQPTISPVLDLGSVSEAGTTLGNFFDKYALNLNTVLDRANLATAGAGPTEVIVHNPTDLTGVQESINTLKEDILGLQEAIGNMKVVLDTGVLAGGVTDDVDLNLGRKNLYASRRN